MTNRFQVLIARLALLFLLLSLAALAQSPDDDPFASETPAPSPAATVAASPTGSPKPTFRVEEQTIYVQDRYLRPFLVPEDTAWLGVRLATGAEQHSKALAHFKEAAAGGQEYAFAEGAEFSRFPLIDGAATVHFVVFSEAGKNPVDYELVLLVGEGPDAQQHPLGFWSVGTGTVADQAQADVLAPHTRNEKLAMGSFVVVSLILTYMLFGRSLFTRFLRNKKMEVSSALGWSNILVLFGFLAIGVCFGVMWLWPKVLWNKTETIYAIMIGGFFLAAVLVYLGGLVVTRK